MRSLILALLGRRLKVTTLHVVFCKHAAVGCHVKLAGNVFGGLPRIPSVADWLQRVIAAERLLVRIARFEGQNSLNGSTVHAGTANALPCLTYLQASELIWCDLEPRIDTRTAT